MTRASRILGLLLALGIVQGCGGERAAKPSKGEGPQVPGKREAAATPVRSRGPVTLLVHGITLDVTQPSETWGRRTVDGWSGMVGFLEKSGLRFGGVIRDRGKGFALPDALDAEGVRGDSRTADFFVLQFSTIAAEDGIGAKTVELVSSMENLKQYTGTTKFRIVAHSAGGIVTRSYVQGATPGLPYRGDVERLITISTPHLGSAAAKYFEGFLGTRATGLKPDSARIVRLNQELDLPSDVYFASIVVRSIWDNVSGKGPEYDSLVDREILRDLPVDYQEGGDGVINVRTQNLRLAACARRYEERTGRAVHYASARVSKTENDRAHTAAPSDENVQRLVEAFLCDDGSCWTGPAGWSQRDQWVHRAAVGCAGGIVESETRTRHPTAGVYGIQVHVAEQGEEKQPQQYHFSGLGQWKGKIVGITSGKTLVEGMLKVSGDRFGRIVRYSYAVDTCREAKDGEAK